MFYFRAVGMWSWQILICHVWHLVNHRYHYYLLPRLIFGSENWTISHKQIGILCPLQLLIPDVDEKKKQRKSLQNPIFMAEPMRASNSFVGTEEYIAPVCALLNLHSLFFFFSWSEFLVLGLWMLCLLTRIEMHSFNDYTLSTMKWISGSLVMDEYSILQLSFLLYVLEFQLLWAQLDQVLYWWLKVFMCHAPSYTRNHCSRGLLVIPLGSELNCTVIRDILIKS